MPKITDNVAFDVIAREWRMKWTEDEEKLSLTQIQEVVDSLNSDISKIEGLETLQRVVCGGCHDYKLIVSVRAKHFEKWEKASFAPEATFLEAVKKIAGVSQVETQTYTLASLRVSKPPEKRRDPTDQFKLAKYTEKEFIKFYGPQEGARVWKDAAAFERKLESQTASARNSAFVFLKPHANTKEVQELVKKTLTEAGIKIQKEGTVKSEVIDKKKLIDQHYYAIASKATILPPKDLNVPGDKFKGQFGLTWEEALAKGNVYNATEACKKLEVDGEGLDKLWAAAKKGGKCVKLGGGFYCALIEAEGKEPLYTFNGFFMSMRGKFTVPGESIYYYVVHWNPKDLSWTKFRDELLGPTDPSTAPESSLRGVVFKDWEKLGLKAVPNMGDNAVHASASPFEGLAERMNWLGTKLEADNFGRLALQHGLPQKMLKDWSVDPQVELEKGSEESPAKKGSLFDAVECLDATECLAKMVELKGFRPPPPPRAPREPKQSRLVKE